MLRKFSENSQTNASVFLSARYSFSMILYHASGTPIPEPSPFHGRKNADMGPGFYLSPDEEFSLLWAREGWYINVYELNDEGLKQNILEINEPWFDAIFQNRNYARDAFSQSDIVSAPIANDTLFDLVGILTSGLIPKATCLKVLSLEPHFTAVVLKSEAAIKNLRFLEARIVSKEQAEKSKIKAAKLSEDFLSQAVKTLGDYANILS